MEYTSNETKKLAYTPRKISENSSLDWKPT